MQNLEHTYTNQLFVAYLTFKFNWTSYILFGNTAESAYPKAFLSPSNVLGSKFL